jgi:ABC-type multidrug transport system fused ATPase/permease subunit
LINIIVGLFPLSSGKLLIDDVVYVNNLDASWFLQIGYVPQDLFVFDGSLAENIALGVPKENIDFYWMSEVCKMAQIYDFIQRQLPNKFDTRVGEQGVQLSGGQRQRIALARALYNKPQILILDEATSALDQETEKRFMNVIYSLGVNLTILVIAHRLTTIAKCDSIYEIRNGILKKINKASLNSSVYKHKTFGY